MAEMLIMLLVLLVFFLLFREVNCWYWKINTLLESLGQMKKKLDAIVSLLERADTQSQTAPLRQSSSPAPEAQSEEDNCELFSCPHCGQLIRMDMLTIQADGRAECPECGGHLEFEA